MEGDLLLYCIHNKGTYFVHMWQEGCYCNVTPTLCIVHFVTEWFFFHNLYNGADSNSCGAGLGGVVDDELKWMWRKVFMNSS
jgi:hypothetical protein